MLTRTRPLLATLLIAVVAVACVPDDAEPSATLDASGSGTAILGEDEPLADDEVTLHMANPPELPPALAGAQVASAELRAEDATDRHGVQLVDVPVDTTTLGEALPAGAVLRVPAGQELEVDASVDVATLDPDATGDEPGVVAGVTSPCASPCTVEGPALVTVEGWMPGFGVAATWQLLVAPPSG